MLAVVTLTSLAAYLVTPEGAMGPPGDPVGIAYNLRYAAPGLALGFALLALAPPLTGVRRQRGLVLALLAVLTATVAEPRLWPAHHLAGAIPVGCAVLIAGVAVIWAARRSARRRTMLFARCASVRAVAFGAVLAVLIAGAAGGYLWQRHYLRERYAFRPGVSQLARLWAFFRSVHHADVGVAGTYVGYFSYPLFGLDDSNRVVYIGRHGPHGSFTPIRSCRQWRRAVAAGRFRYVVTTPARDLFRPRLLNRSPEFGWTVSDPHARLVFRDLAQGQPIAVFELHGSLQPAGCR
jgi:hypothetical protein